MKNSTKFLYSYFCVLFINKILINLILSSFLEYINNYSYILTIIGLFTTLTFTFFLSKNIQINIHTTTLLSIDKFFIIFGCASVLLLFFSSVFLYNSFNKFNLYFDNQFSYSYKYQVASQTLVILIIILGIIPSLVEEMFYRKLFYFCYKGHSNFYIIMLSSILFSFAHNGYMNKIMAFILGIILMKVFIYSKSIRFTMFLHFMYNVSFILYEYKYYYLFENDLIFYQEKTKYDLLSSALIDLSILFSICGVYLLCYVIYHTYKKSKLFKK